ncbi:MAG: Clp protease N-terminal domain-containing protein, partial [Planctomycetaceae bacterium]
MPFRPEKLTVKSQEALQRAQGLAEERAHSQLQPLHLLKALLDESDGVVRPLLNKIGANAAQLTSLVDGELERLPKVTGAAAQVGAAADVMAVLNKAADVADEMKDEFVSTEHVLLALTEVDGPAQRLLKINGVEKRDVLAALQSVRGGQRVTDRSPEDKFQALEKYGH